MGYDLTNSKGQEFRFDTTDFPKVLNLAEYFGWEPMGTILNIVSHKLNFQNKDDIRDGTIQVIEPHGNWGYTTNYWQLVVQKDAFNLAKALKTAVKALTEESFFSDEEIKEGFDGDGDCDIIFLIKYFSIKNGKEYLEDFIHFCMGGEFGIGRPE